MWLQQAHLQPEVVTNIQEVSTRTQKPEEDGVPPSRGRKPYPISGPRGCHKFQTSITLMLSG